MLGANPLPESENTTEISTTNTMLPLNETSNLNTTNSEEFVCAFYNPEFIIISSLGSFYIPCVIMIFLYIRIFSVSTYKNIFVSHLCVRFLDLYETQFLRCRCQFFRITHITKSLIKKVFLYKKRMDSLFQFSSQYYMQFVLVSFNPIFWDWK